MIRVSASAAIARWPDKIKPGSQNGALVQYVDVLPTLLAAAGANPAAIDTGCLTRTAIAASTAGVSSTCCWARARTCGTWFSPEHTTRGIIRGSDAYATRSVFDGHWKLVLNVHSDAGVQQCISNGEMIQSWRKKGQQGDAFAAAQAARYTKRPAVELYDLQADPLGIDRPGRQAGTGRDRRPPPR